MTRATRQGTGWFLILGSLLTTACSREFVSYRARAREIRLRENLYVLRHTIDQYTLDKQAAPSSLADLVRAGYLREIPKDITGTSATWHLDSCEHHLSSKQTLTGLCDVHSGSSEISTEGTPYNSW